MDENYATPMIRSQLRTKRLLLLAGDFAILQAALVFTLFIRYGDLHTWSIHIAPFTVIALLWMTGFYITGLYDLSLGQETIKLFRTFLEGMIANLAVAFGFFYLVPIFTIAPRTNLFLYFAVSLLLGYAWRLFFHRFAIRHFTRGRVLFIGPAGEAGQVYKLLETSALGLELVAAISTSGTPDPSRPIRWIPSTDHLSEVIDREGIQAIVLGVSPDSLPELSNSLYDMLFAPITILDRAEIEEATTGRIPLTHVTQSWFLHHLNESEKAWYETMKRAADILLSIPFALLTIITFPLVALAVRLSSKGPTFYSQIRVGMAGKEIRIWKYRTMVLDAEKYGPQFTADTEHDPRVTGVGRILRQLRIDELPQIWSVLKGDLSLIGPRPERPEFVAPLLSRMPYYRLRLLTRPGLTGWAQVRFLTPTSSLEDNLKKLQYDLYYIKHRSFMLDLAILLKTIGIVLRRQGT